MNILIFNNGVVCSDGMSGSDRRAIHWSKLFAFNHKISVVIPEFASKRFNNIKKIYYTAKKEGSPNLLTLIVRMISGVFISLILRRKKFEVVYSTCDLLPDAVPAIVFKLLRPKIVWITGLHLIAPSPLKGYRYAYDNQWEIPTLKSIYYFLTQFIIIHFMKKLATIVFVSNNGDREKLLGKGFAEKQVLVTYGAPEWNTIRSISERGMKWDVCFIARFHPQKGWDDLFQSWSIIQNKCQHVKLAIIGDIPPEILEQKIKKNHINSKDVHFFGFLDGAEKYSVLSQSKVLAFPSHYESFGMVAAEAQACKVPVVAYNLPFYSDIYPKGMICVERGNYRELADTIYHLLTHEDERLALSNAAFANAKRFDFEITGKEILNRLEMCL